MMSLFGKHSINTFQSFHFRWLILALFFKLIFFVWFTYSLHQIWPENKIVKGVFVKSWEYGDYLYPVENLIDHGSYYSWDNDKNEKLYMNRMPGFLPIYGPLYFLGGREYAYFFLVLLHYIADVLGVYLLSLCALKLFKDKKAFYFTFFIYAISAFVTTYNNHGYSEPFCVFTLILSIYFLIKALTEKKDIFFLFSGLFFCWSIFFRAATGSLIVVFPLIILFFEKFSLTRWRWYFKSLTLFLFPFLFFISIWTIRNYRIANQIVPLANTTEIISNKQTRALFKLIIAWGGDVQPWNPKSEGRWFKPPFDKRFDKKHSETNPFKDYIFTKQYGFKEIKDLRYYYSSSVDPNNSSGVQAMYADSVVTLVAKYIKAFKEEKPFHYYVTAKLNLFKDFIFVRQTYALPFEQNTLYHKLVRAFFFLLYYLVMTGGLLGVFWAFFKAERSIKLFALLPMVYIGGYIMLGYIENRYLAEAYPLMVLFLSFLAIRIILFLKSIRSTRNPIIR